MKTIFITVILLLTSTVFAQSVSKTIKKEKQVTNPFIGVWEFHEITIRTPKDGYLMRISEREIDLMNLIIANYIFHEDGSIILDPKYMEKQGVKKATWAKDDSTSITITYFWTAEKQKAKGYTNDYEKITYTIQVVPNQKLSLNLQDMFIVNLIHK